MKQASNQGGKAPPRNFFDPLEKYVGHTVVQQQIWATLRKLFVPHWCPKLVTGLI